MTTARGSTPPRRTATDRYAVAADYASGMTVAAIAEKHRVGVTPLYRILDEFGIERRQVHQPKLAAGQRRRGTPAAQSTGQQTSRSWRRTRLAEFDVDALISDYGNEELTVTAICETHKIGLTKLYQLLDRHRVERRRPNAPKIPLRRRRGILDDYLAGVGVAEIARRHRVSESTVSLIAQREGVSRVRARTREEIVDLAVRG